MGLEWTCRCKDCDTPFAYSNTKYEAGRVRGWSRPERCDECRAQHAREIQSVGQAYYKVKSLKAVGDPKRLTSDLGRFNREDRPHEEEEIRPAPIDPGKFGIKDDRLVEMFHFFKQDPGLQVAVVVGPTGSGKSTYFPYRLVELPKSYVDGKGNTTDTYWTAPIETDADLEAARGAVKHTVLSKGHHRHYMARPEDPRAVAHKVTDLDPRMFHRYGQIVVTQPRIQATRNIPEFIAKAMMGCRLGAGHDVGFRHSGSPNSDWSTKLAFVTDGTLITWLAKGELDKINTVMIDEAHERSLNIDIIIGMLTQLLPRHPRLRLIIASATIAADKFIDHFNKHLPQRRDAAGNVLPNCRLMEFEGKSFRVTPHFRRPDEAPLGYYRESLPARRDGKVPWEGRYREPREAHQHVAEQAAELLKAMYDTDPNGGYLTDHAGQKIDMTERQGDILGFLHGEAPIQKCCRDVERLAGEALGERVRVRALPLYTTLKQSEQDEALKEREQPHGVLFKRLVERLEEVATGRRQPGDILAILNNAGQIHNLCADLERRVAAPTITIKRDGKDLDIPNPLAALQGKVVFAPWFTPETGRQLFETMPERANLQVPAPRAGVMRVVISTSRHRASLNAGEFKDGVELPPEERRVVVSTNVAETSLTIHGILHVVDSGLINQNKWDAPTQTSAVAPILQSRAGCKQRWGRAGRLQAGDAWLLYTEAQFGNEQEEADESSNRCFDFYSRPEISRSPLEQVLLTAKKAGVESLDPAQFPWLDAPDSDELARSERSLVTKGALDDDGDLTEHGVELSNMRSDPRVGNMLIVADRFACALEMATAISVAAEGLKGLLAFDKQWDDQTILEVRHRQSALLSGSADDLDAALRLVACWEEVFSAGRAFVQLVRLFTHGDELQRLFDNAPQGEEGERIRRLVRALRRTTDERETSQLTMELTRLVRRRQAELRTAAESSLAIRREYTRLGSAWQAVVSGWAFARIWDEAVAAPILAECVLKPGNPPAEREEAVAIIADFLAELREALASGDDSVRACCGRLARTLGSRVVPERPSINLLVALARIADPRFAQDPDAVARALEDLQRSDRELLARALARLPEAAARAWARASYLMPDALAEVVAARAELLEPLEAHKKGAESRPLDLTRNDRLRALFAHSLPDNAFLKDAAGAYRPAAQNCPAEKLDVEPAADSVCAAVPPDLFVCVERRAGPIAEGKDRKLFASFIVRLPVAWARAMGDTDQPLHKMSSVRLGRFIAESCRRDPLFGSNLLMDMVFPRGARCRVKTVRELGPGVWEAETEPPHSWPAPVVPRFKRASVEESAETETEEVIRSPRAAPKDLALTNHQRALTANEATEDSDKGRIDANEWESLFQTNVLNAHADANPPAEASEVVVSERAPRPAWAEPKTPAVLSAGGRIQPGATVDAEVAQLAPSSSGALVPHLSHPVRAGQFEAFTRAIGPADIGREFTLTVVRVERLLLDAGSVLVARERTTGCEVTFGPRDVSFSACGAIPELIARRLPIGSQFSARLVQIDPESGRVRMTTHHVYARDFADPQAVTGRQTVEVIQTGSGNPFVRLVRPEESERHGFTMVARLDEDQLRGATIGTSHTVHLSLPNRTRESWPQGVAAPADLQNDGPPIPEAVIARGLVTEEQVARWLKEVGDNRPARAAIYSLYERTHQLSAMDEAEYRRWESCIGKTVKARVTECNANGLQLDLAGLHGVPVWLQRDEYSWHCDETHADAKVGTELTVTGMEIELARRRILASRRRLTANPYLNYNPGETVSCSVTMTTDKGAELDIDRLQGWIFNDRLVHLPQERLNGSEGGRFDATVVRVATEDGKITVSRWPQVQQLLRTAAEAMVLIGEVSRIEATGVGVMLAPGIEGWMPGEEATWTQGRAELARVFHPGQRLEAVLLPRGPMDREDNIRVSRKRAWSCEYLVGGKPGLFFGKQWANVRAVLDRHRRSGPAAVDKAGEVPGAARVLVGADDRRTFEALISDLAALARSTGCSFTQTGTKRAGPAELKDLVLPSTHRNRRVGSKPTVATTTVAPRKPPGHILARVGSFFRRLFGSK